MLPSCDRTVSVPRNKYLPSAIRGVPLQQNSASLGGQLRRRRLELNLFQSKAARILKVSNRTLSLWESDKLHPTWFYWPCIVAYLGRDPFADSSLGRAKGNETQGVAFLALKDSRKVGDQMKYWRMLLHKTRAQLAVELGVCAKTIWAWENHRRAPSAEIQNQLKTSLFEITTDENAAVPLVIKSCAISNF
jgi:DNA-binding XRE family transcriptional regulator